MIRSENRRKRPKFEKFPVKFPVSREFAPETGSPLTGSSARQSGLRGFISPLGRIADIPVGYAGRSQSLVGNFPYFGPCGAGFGRRSLVAIFQFPFRAGRRPVRLQTETGSQGTLGGSGGRRHEVHSFGRLFGRHTMRFLSGKAVFAPIAV